MERDRRELEVQTMLAMPLLMSEGYTAPAVKRAFARAFELTEGAEFAPELLSSLFGLFRYALVGGELAQARKLAEQMMRVAEQEPEQPRYSTACLAAASVQYHMGALEQALALLHECLRAHDSGSSGQRLMQHGEDDVSMALAHAAWIQTVLGYPDRAAGRAAQLRERAESLDHPFARMESHVFLAFLAFISRDVPQALAEAEAGLSLGQRHEFSPLMMASLTLHRGWALSLCGQGQDVLPGMRAAVAGIEAAGVRLWYSFSCLALGEACSNAGQSDEALNVVEDASAVALELGQGGWLPECQRLVGEVLLRSSSVREPSLQYAEKSLMNAIRLARRQRAKLTELRALSSLTRLRLRLGSAGDALRMLAEVYGRFDEGLYHPDVVAAKQLLSQGTG
jgi:tetratricopeptide (TPR) repeat protein